jgi:hypothetical protein
VEKDLAGGSLLEEGIRTTDEVLLDHSVQLEPPITSADRAKPGLLAAELSTELTL